MGNRGKISALALALGLAAAPVLAAMPDYDVDGYCKKIGETVGGSQSIIRTCIGQEQRAYDHLKAAWDGLDEGMRNYCDRIGKTVGGSYSILETCIGQEQAAKKANDQTKFKR